MGIRILRFLLPVFGMLLAKYVFNKKHIIDEEKCEQIVEELLMKRGGLSEEKETETDIFEL